MCPPPCIIDELHNKCGYTHTALGPLSHMSNVPLFHSQGSDKSLGSHPPSSLPPSPLPPLHPHPLMSWGLAPPPHPPPSLCSNTQPNELGGGGYCFELVAENRNCLNGHLAVRMPLRRSSLPATHKLLEVNQARWSRVKCGKQEHNTGNAMFTRGKEPWTLGEWIVHSLPPGGQ